MDFIRDHFLIIAGIGVSVVIGIIIWSVIYTSMAFHITSVTPTGPLISNYQPRIVLEFNKELSKENIKVVFDGKNVETNVDGSSLTVTLSQSMIVDNEYILTIRNIESVSGDSIKNKNYIYTASNDPGLISAEDDKIILERQDANKEKLFSDPIMRHLPYGTLDYSISGSENSNGTITVTITLILSAADARTGRQAAIDKYKAEATKYLSSLSDINIKDYEVKTIISEPPA